MPEIAIKMTPNHSVKLKRFKAQTGTNMKKALSQIGRVIAKQAKRNISGEGFTRNPGRGSIYPGQKSGGLNRGLIPKMGPKGDYVDIGSNVHYARHVVPASMGGTYKGKKITGHFLFDVLKQKDKEILDIFNGKLWKPLK